MSDVEPKSIFDIKPDEALEARRDAEAEADFAAGRVVPHAKVVAWLKSWGTPDELPCPSSKTP
jgi:predicted transcriptional regulator